ncbi:MAG: SRPBCC family protein [Chloroflexota bacterium]
MPHFIETIVINRPVDEVVAFASDWFNGPRDGSVLAFRQTSAGPPGVGTTLEGRMVILGFETRFKTRITEWDLPRAAMFVSAGGPFRSIVLRVTIEPRGNGTEMVESREMELRPALKLLGPLVVPYWRRRTRAVQKNFKRLVEAQPRHEWG